LLWKKEGNGKPSYLTAITKKLKNHNGERRKILISLRGKAPKKSRGKKRPHMTDRFQNWPSMIAIRKLWGWAGFHVEKEEEAKSQKTCTSNWLTGKIASF